MNRNFTRAHATIGALLGAMLMSAGALPARAQDEQILIAPARTTTYVNGGVGTEEEAHMQRIARDWPLRLFFSERKDGEFVADASVAITDHRGAQVLVLHGAGPMTYAMLPAGRYRVTASFRGVTETREVTLDGKRGKDVYFHWKGKPKLDPWDGGPIGGKQSPG